MLGLVGWGWWGGGGSGWRVGSWLLVWLFLVASARRRLRAPACRVGSVGWFAGVRCWFGWFGWLVVRFGGRSGGRRCSVVT